MIEINDSNRKQLSLVYGRAKASQMGVITDTSAEQIAGVLDREGTRMDYNKYLSVFLGVKARLMDEITQEYIHSHPDCTVIHLGCGLDSRFERMGEKPAQWIDLDFPHIIDLRRQFFSPKENYRMISADAADWEWLDEVGDLPNVFIVAEGFTMFLTAQENLNLFQAFRDRFSYSEYLMDVYTERTVVFANSSETQIVRGKTVLWGLSDPKLMERIPGVRHLRTYDFNYPRMIRSVPLLTRVIYRLFYGKKSINRLYRIYRFGITGDNDPDQM